MAVTATKVFPPGSPKTWDWEIHTIVWTSTTATVELSTGLSEIYGFIPVAMYGADAGHANGAHGVLELDETATAGVITPVSGAVTINRFEGDDATALTGQSSLVILFGKS